MRQLEAQLGVALLDRSGRVLGVTAAGEQLLVSARGLLAAADEVVASVRAVGAAAVGRLRLGLTPTARYGLAPELLAACADRAPGVMLYPAEDATGALLRDVRSGRLDLAVVFCASGVRSTAWWSSRCDPSRRSSTCARTILWRIVRRCGWTSSPARRSSWPRARTAAGSARGSWRCARPPASQPVTRPDPYPDLGLQAVREGLGIVLYVRSAFPPEVEGSAFVPVEPVVGFPFAVALRDAPLSAPVAAVLGVLRGL